MTNLDGLYNEQMASHSESASAKKIVPRDPARTRARILKAAIAEFSAKGYSGARTVQIASRAKSNIRMLYHYFGGKDALYVCVLEEVLSKLRAAELQLDFDALAPTAGILQMFDFIDTHFGARPELRRLLAYENMNQARHLKRSALIREGASPVLDLIGNLLRRGEAIGLFRPGVDPLHLYVAMVSMAYYSRAHGPTLSRIFETDLLADDWQAAHRTQSHEMLMGFLAPVIKKGRKA
ncbi:TetR/AcrR family transcriptional regulator [Variovorax sp. J22G21]|uniref:TetR/AcrR family transcriptional regulator n=1 Tax=Variovorax ginsengisoli TaxID=363844 RepID=A0ABT8SEE1_9BURK|nr:MULTISPECIES: TetR/AcrR family transcriptional regulator [Variovorax]MDM0042755.1 TetR/AcrR family transcriptional regulator [Variovorax sp. J22R193]MDM0064850.1 TetR/AcrR family transcriptional regulator [Variovorax sp. J22G21]MDN8618131.1 TetR/AcrR family transcriptional regulator [Variovorax ginsengisoli]MDO1537301.1 TetR/AcrR family transcriptional regulator [Variovorax ginsengisoli]